MATPTDPALSEALIPYTPPRDQETSQLKPLNLKVYEAYFNGVKSVVDTLKAYSFNATGAAIGMTFLELPTILYAGWDNFKHQGHPTMYGFNRMFRKEETKNPVLLIHGAVGTWGYLSELGGSLKEKGWSVHVINLDDTSPTEKKRTQVFTKVREILAIDRTAAKVDLIAHSIGGYSALHAAVDKDSSTVEDGNIILTSDKAETKVGKIITLALPFDEEEVDILTRINKLPDAYNITAKYDGIMGHKTVRLPVGQYSEIDAGHVGIVYHPNLADRVESYLRLD